MSAAPLIATAQCDLFGVADALPPGLRFAPDFIDAATERDLLALAATLPLHEARYKQYTARRRVHAYGARFDFDTGVLSTSPLGALPPVLDALRAQLAGWVGIDAADFVHVMVAEYSRGTPLGWHRDAPGYEVIVGVSLGGPATLRFRPWPHAAGNDPGVQLALSPRSAYVMRDQARWGWQHSVPPVPALRHAVTMRTARARQGVGHRPQTLPP